MKSFWLQAAVVAAVGWGIGLVVSPDHPKAAVNFATLTAPDKQPVVQAATRQAAIIPGARTLIITGSPIAGTYLINPALPSGGVDAAKNPLPPLQWIGPVGSGQAMISRGGPDLATSRFFVSISVPIGGLPAFTGAFANGFASSIEVDGLGGSGNGWLQGAGVGGTPQQITVSVQ